MTKVQLVPQTPLTANTTRDGLDVAIPAEGGSILLDGIPDLSASSFLVLDVTSISDMHRPFSIDFYAAGAEKPNMNMTTSSIPYVRAVMPYSLQWLDNQQVFQPRTPGRFKTTVFGEALEPGDVKAVRLTFRKHETATRIVFHDAYFTDTEPDTALVAAKPVVDELGQVSIRDWPGKTKDADAMIARIQGVYQQALESDKRGMPYPERYRFSAWGGDIDNKVADGSGFFSVTCKDGIWHLVDPDGYAFFSVGPDCIGGNTAGVTEGIEALYEWLPPHPEYEDAYRGEAARNTVDFYRVNLRRALGDGWFDKWTLMTEYQLKQWGFNTIGNWSDMAFIRKSRLPFVLPLNGFPSTQRAIFRDFPDVFSDEYERNSAAFARQMNEFKDEPRLIGYFMRNEPQWGFSDNINLAREMFRSAEPAASRDELYRWLLRRYSSLSGLASAWNVALGDEAAFHALPFSFFAPDGKPYADLMEFSAAMVKRYVTVPAEALRAVAPHHLNLGMRYAFISTDSMFEGADQYDVYSINCYRPKPRESDVQNILRLCGRPALIGEFHYGTSDRGCFGNSLRATTDQTERGLSYQYFVEQSAAMPSMVGCHYFCLGDEASLGRYDGECWQFGIIDVCQLPYDEFVDAVIRAHERMYRVKRGALAACDTPANESPANGY